MSRRESRLSTGRTNRPQSVLDDAAGGRDSPARPSGRLSAVEMLRVGTAAGPQGDSGRRHSRSALGHADETRMSVSVGKTGPGPEGDHGDALDRLLSGSPQRRDGPGPTSAHRNLPAPGDAAPDGAQQREETRQSRTGTRADHPPGTSFSEAKERFLALPMTPKAAEQARLDRIRGGYSRELKELQLKLMSDEGKPFSELQKAFVFAKESGAGKSSQTSDDKLKSAITAATDISPSNELIQELRKLTKTKPGKPIDYESMMHVVWDDEYLALPKVGAYFQVGQICWIHNSRHRSVAH